MSSGSIDAAVNGQGKKWKNYSYVFSGSTYYRYDWTTEQVSDGYPRRTDEPKRWPGVPKPLIESVDAAVTGGGKYGGKSLFFRDGFFYVFDWSADSFVGSATEIRQLGILEPFASGVTAAVEGQGTRFGGTALMTRGDRFIAYDWNSERAVEEGSLRDLGLPEGFASGVTAATSGAGRKGQYAYFFNGGDYLRYDWARGAVSQVDPPYPLGVKVMNRGNDWPGLSRTTPGRPSTAESLTIRVIVSASGVGLAIPHIGTVSVSSPIAQIGSGPPNQWFEGAKLIGFGDTVGYSYIDTGQYDFGRVDPAKAYRWKHLHGKVVTVKVEPLGPFAIDQGKCRVVLTQHENQGGVDVPQPLEFEVTSAKGVSLSSTIEFSTEFLQLAK